jgi:iron complex transport system substrate-binding protein
MPHQAQVWSLGYDQSDTLTLPKPNPSWRKVACISTTHVSMIEAIGQIQKLKAIQFGEFVYHPQVRKLLENGQILDLGRSESLSGETLLELGIEALFVFGMKTVDLQSFENLKKLGISIIPVGEWMEQEPLGRAEWLKFFGFFLDAMPQADSVFEAVEANYLSLQSQPCENSLKVISGIGYSGQWAAPGGKSYMAKMLEQACGDYIFKNDTTSGSISLGFEGFLLQGLKTQIWLNPGTARSLQELLSSEPRLKYLVQGRRIFNCTKRVSSQGGFDFYESGAWRADLILSDLKQILQGKELQNAHFYQELK